MAEQEEKLMLICTHAIDNPEVAAIPFAMAVASMAMDVKATIILQADGVYLAKKGFIETMPKPGGFDPFTKLMSDFMDLGGELRVCAPCIKDRNIEESDLIKGAKIIAGGQLVNMALEANAVFTY